MMSGRLRRFVAVLACMVAVGGMATVASSASAQYSEPDQAHSSSGLLTNGDIEAGAGNSATGWLEWGNGYSVDGAISRSGSRSLTCQLTAAGECGAYQGVVMNRTKALPIKVTGWSRSQSVSGTSSNDYSLWVDLTYSDNTSQFGEAKPFTIGTHDWQQTAFYVDPAKPVKSLIVYVLLKNKTGKVWFDDLSIQELPADLLPGGTFETTSSQVDGWGSWESGYTVAGGEGRGGTDAVKMTSSSSTQQYGIYRTVTLNQSAVKPLLVRGWSKASSVSSTPGLTYSLYADIAYRDGTFEYGLNQQFEGGTHDWQAQQLHLVPAKPVKSVTIYALFRGGTGTVWFDNLSLEQLADYSGGGAVMGKLNPATTAANILTNGSFETLSADIAAGWGTLGDGYTTDATGGHDGARAVKVDNASATAASGIYQTLQLNQTAPKLIQVTGWSKAAGVSGDIDKGYALYMDVFYADGSTDYAVTAPFATGTHDWVEGKLDFQPQKPVQLITLYGIFRDGHQGSAWFDDFSVRQISTEAASFEDAIVRPLPYAPGAPYTTLDTSDGLELALGQRGIPSLKWSGTELGSADTPSGFLARDQQSDSDVFAFDRIAGGGPDSFSGRSDALDLQVDADFTADTDGIKVSGQLSDLRGADRAVTLSFALPVDATNWMWGDYIRQERTIQTGQAGDVYRNTVTPDFETGPMSIYPISAIYNPATGAGLSLGVDYGKPTHYRLDYNGSTKQLTISFELGLSPDSKDPSTGKFGFVIYGFNGSQGFRGAFDKYMKMFPDYYQVRIPDQGIWMPFASISSIPNSADFGFRFKEGDDDPVDTAYANAHDILVFHYQELGSWWQKVDLQLPKTVATAESVRDAQATAGDESARMAQSAALASPAGDPYLQWVNAPWNTGALWMINANPDLPGATNGYTRYFSQDQLDARYNTTGPKPDGEYLDTLDGWPYTLDYDRDHFGYATTPLTFSTVTKRPAVDRAFATWEATTRIAGELHDDGRYLMANGTPHNYSIYTPWLDAMGIERNWLGAGNTFTPDTDETLSKYRTLSGAKPFLMLQNTDFSQFSNADMQLYMKKLLFYGIFPSAFSATADDASNYWKNASLYERDRALFVKYVPLVRAVAEAGWEPLTDATPDSSTIAVERYGHGSHVYLTLMNQGTSTATTTVTFDAAAMGLGATVTGTETTTNSAVTLSGQSFSMTLAPDEVKVVELTSAQSIDFAAIADGAYGDADFTLTATATSGLPVSYTAAGAACTVEDDVVRIGSVGSCSITATQAGDDRFDAAESVTRTFTVAPAATAVTAADASTSWGTAANVIVNVGSTIRGTITGDVALEEGTTSLGVAALNNGQARFALPPGLGGGDHHLTATYLGAGNYGTDRATLTVAVVLPAQWTSTRAYQAGDRVSYNGSVFSAQNYSKAEKPGSNVNGAWEELAMNTDGTAVWTSSRVFRAGDVASYQGKTFRAGWYTRNEKPGSVTGPWEEIATATDGTALWTPSRTFNAGDTAAYNGVTYVAKWYTRNQAPDTANSPWGAVH